MMKTLGVIYDEEYGRKFEIVDEFPSDYEVWNIPANYPAKRCIPLCKILEDGIHVDLESLKVLIVDEKVSYMIMSLASRRSFKREDFNKFMNMIAEVEQSFIE